MTEHKNIQEALNAIMHDVGYVQKTKGGNLSYTYASEKDLIAACRPAMVEHGVFMHVAEIKNVVRGEYTSKNGAAMTNTLITAVIRFEHVGGSFIDVQATGEGSDAGDKSANKALTGLYKYALRQTLCIETGDDPDQFSSDEQEKGKSEAPKTNTASTPPALKTITSQMIVDKGLAENNYEANAIMSNLSLKGADRIVGLKKAYLYRKWREEGREVAEANELTLKGDLPIGFDKEQAKKALED